MSRHIAPWLLATLLLLPGCRSGSPEADRASLSPAERATLELFALTGPDEPDPARIDALFGNTLEDRQRAALGDALQSIDYEGEARIRAIEEIEGPDLIVADVELELASEGLAEFSVHLERMPDGAWLVRWFAGPGVDWPPHRAGRGPGLSTSHGKANGG